MLNNKMMNEMNKKMGTTDFFALNLKVPMCAKVEITVDGEKMVYDENGVVTRGTDLVSCEPVMDAMEMEIMNDGYVKNNHLFRRWITAQTFRALEFEGKGSGYDACIRECYNYNYFITQLMDEIHAIAEMEADGDEEMFKRTRFFNKDVVVQSLNKYIRDLRRWFKSQIRDKHRTVRTAKFGEISLGRLDLKIREMERLIREMDECDSYMELDKKLRRFYTSFYNKLPKDTPKPSAWHDAFKGAGAYYSLQNLILFHECGVELFGVLYYGDTAMSIVNNMHFTWEYMDVLKRVIKDNNFNLRESIARHK